jgi:DNA-binding transcriptional ArsR family regulator
MPTKPLPTPEATPDYELNEYVMADSPGQLKALGDGTRKVILDLLLDRAGTTTHLAQALSKPKGTVGYHLKVLEEAGLIRVVRRRKVRAMTEKYYGRVGRTIVYGGIPDGGKLWMLSEALDEAVADGGSALPVTTLRHVRIHEEDAAAFAARVLELSEEFVRMRRSGSTVYGFVAAVYPTTRPVLKEDIGE